MKTLLTRTIVFLAAVAFAPDGFAGLEEFSGNKNSLQITHDAGLYDDYHAVYASGTIKNSATVDSYAADGYNTVFETYEGTKLGAFYSMRNGGGNVSFINGGSVAGAMSFENLYAGGANTAFKNMGDVALGRTAKFNVFSMHGDTFSFENRGTVSGQAAGMMNFDCRVDFKNFGVIQKTGSGALLQASGGGVITFESGSVADAGGYSEALLDLSNGDFVIDVKNGASLTGSMDIQSGSTLILYSGTSGINGAVNVGAGATVKLFWYGAAFVANGDFRVDGANLEIVTADGLFSEADIGTTFTVMEGVVGSFDSENTKVVSGGHVFGVDLTGGSLSLTYEGVAVPEAAHMALILGAIVLVFCRYRKIR